jgi:NADH:ubiquinone oxidoreductase subunit E
MKVSVCIGSSCHLKGSRKVVEEFQRQIAALGLKKEVDLSGAFCMGNCASGVCVKVEGEMFSVQPQAAKEFFMANIRPCAAS